MVYMVTESMLIVLVFVLFVQIRVSGRPYLNEFHDCRCYCILHEENVLGAIFSSWKELRMAASWEEVEQTVWGELNNYRGFS